jgi:hypothetical protein
MTDQQYLTTEEYQEAFGIDQQTLATELTKILVSHGYDMDSSSMKLRRLDHISINPKSRVYVVSESGSQLARMSPPLIIRKLMDVETMGGLERASDEFAVQDAVLKANNQCLREPHMFIDRTGQITAFPPYYNGSEVFRNQNIQVMNFLTGSSLEDTLKLATTPGNRTELQLISDALDPMLVLVRFLGLDKKVVDIETTLGQKLPQVNPTSIKEKMLRHLRIIDQKYFVSRERELSEQIGTLANKLENETKYASVMMQGDGRPKHYYSNSLVDPRIVVGPLSMQVGYLLCNSSVLWPRERNGTNALKDYLRILEEKDEKIKTRDRIEGIHRVGSAEFYQNVLLAGLVQCLESVAGIEFYLGRHIKTAEQSQAYTQQRERETKFALNYLSLLKNLGTISTHTFRSLDRVVRPSN